MININNSLKIKNLEAYNMSDTIYYPLTSPQKSIWYTERMYSGTSISNVAGTLRI